MSRSSLARAYLAARWSQCISCGHPQGSLHRFFLLLLLLANQELKFASFAAEDRRPQIKTRSEASAVKPQGRCVQTKPVGLRPDIKARGYGSHGLAHANGHQRQPSEPVRSRPELGASVAIIDCTLEDVRPRLRAA